MYNYCTLFDSFYLTRGLTMYESLKKQTDNFHLYIFAFDDKCYKILTLLNLKSATIISLKEFESKELLKLKNSRTQGEYCWTCTPSTIKYCIENFNLKNCTYLDADLFFFANPSILIEELSEDKSVLITEHRYTNKYDQTKSSGKYCVQFMTFKNNVDGMEVLNWWIDACNEWCYARAEDGKFGDQKYLDDWMDRFDCVYELQNLGGGIAPWNMQQYDFNKENENIIGTVKNSDINFKVIFFHFHNFKIVDTNLYAITSYQLFDDCRNTIYLQYIKYLENINIKVINEFNLDFYEYKLKKNFYMIYSRDTKAYLHA